MIHPLCPEYGGKVKVQYLVPRSFPVPRRNACLWLGEGDQFLIGVFLVLTIGATSLPLRYLEMDNPG